MHIYVNKNVVETDAKIYEFASGVHAQNFINCLQTKNEAFCSIQCRPVNIISKPSFLPFAFWRKVRMPLTIGW